MISKKSGLNWIARCILLLVLISGSAFADKPKVNGYYIDKNGTTFNVTMEVTTGLLSDKIWIHAHQTAFNYYDKKGKKVKMGLEDANEYGFTYLGEKYVFQFVPAKEEYAFLGFKFIGHFYRLILDGPCKLYFIIIQTTSNNTSTTFEENMFLKNKDDLYVTRSGMRKLSISTNEKSLDEFFSDCPALASKIKNKEYKKDDNKYYNMALYYNKVCNEQKKEPEPEQEQE